MSARNSLADACAAARTFLFVPGNRPERFEKASRSGADVVILDLEDSVPDAAKPAAREAIAREWERLAALDVPVALRVNAFGTEAGRDDLAWAGPLNPVAVVAPKAESAEALAAMHEGLGGASLVPLVESAAGWQALPVLSGAPGVLRLAVGHIDFMADTGLQCDSDESELAPLRFAVAMATRMHRLAPAIDGVTVQIDDEERLRRDTRRAVRFGFGGKLCIHPRQVAIVHECLAPTQEELAWARRVVEADANARGAAVKLDGRMIDVPVVLQARRTLARATKERSR